MKEVSRFHAPVFGARARPEWVLKILNARRCRTWIRACETHRATGADVRFDPMAPLRCSSLRKVGRVSLRHPALQDRGEVLLK